MKFIKEWTPFVLAAVLTFLVITLSACGVKSVTEPEDETATTEAEVTTTEQKDNTSEIAKATTTEAVTETATEAMAAGTTEQKGQAVATTATSRPAGTTEAPRPAATTEVTPSPVFCEHNWVEQTETVHHEAVGHVVNETRVYRSDTNEDVTGSEFVWHDGVRSIRIGGHTVWICQCGYTSVVENDMYNHRESYGASEERLLYHSTIRTTYEYDYVSVYEKTVATFVEDRAAYDEVVVTGYKCSKCGETK